MKKLWTPQARTYREEGGANVSLLYPAPVNFKDANGDWQEIDNTLVRSSAAGYGYENKANSYKLLLPSDLGSTPVKYSFDGGWVSFALDGAKGHGAVDGVSARFANALPQTSVTYTAAPDVAKETLTLASPRAPRTFTYAVRVSDGLTAREAQDGGIDFVNGAGKVAARFFPPFMTDAAGAGSGAVAMKLAAGSGGYTVTLIPDASWLTSPARQWPITIDPDTGGSSGAFTDCYISSAAPTANLCAAETDLVGWDGGAKRALLDFGVQGSIRSTAVVLDAQLSLYLESETSTASAPVSVYNATKQFSNYATWNRYDYSFNNGDKLWSTPGGDIDTSAASTQTVGGSTGQTVSWDVRQLVQNQANGTDAGGFLLKQAAENVSNVLGFTGSYTTGSNPLPELRVFWEYATGERSLYRYDSMSLDDRMGLSVNVASGNLLLQADDLDLQGTGLDLSFGHYYNSLNSVASPTWGFGPGKDVHLTFFADGTVAYYGPTGFAVPFAKNGSAFTSPTGIDADLTASGGTLAKCSGAAYSYRLLSHDDESSDYFDTNGYLVATVDQNGNANCYRYDANFNLTSIVDTQGRTTTLSYSGPCGQPSQVTDPGGRLYKYGYNATTCYLTSYTDPMNGVTRYAYDASAMLSQVTDPKGIVTKITYGNYGRVASIVRNSTGPTTTYSYNSLEDLSTPPYFVKETDPLNHATTFYYDGLDRITKTVDANGNTNQTSYNANSDPLTETDALGNVTNYSYDSNNNLLSIQSPTGAKEQLAYTDTSHLWSSTGHTDAQGNTWAYAYDPAGNLSSKTEGAGQNPVQFTYNANGTVATATDAKGAVTSYGYDAKGNLTSITQPAPLGAESFTYDSLSRVATAVDGAGHSESYTYDALNRITKITYSDSSTITYAYDLDGNTTSTVDNSGTTSFTYDNLNRLTKETLPGAKTNSYTYDSASNLTQFTDAGGTVKYGYDPADRLTSLTEPNAKVTSFGYDKNDNRTSTAYPNGVTMSMAYDASQRLTTVSAAKGATQLTSFTYSYVKGAADTNLRQSHTAMVLGLYGSETTTYGYDTLNRLTSATSGSASYSYTYDASGNMTSKTVNGTTTTYGYNAANELTSQNGAGGFTYDGNGNLTGSPAFSALAYNVKDQTSSITPTGGSALNLGYSGPTQALRVSAGGTSYTNSFLLGLTYEKTGTATTYYTREPSGDLAEQRSPAGNYYYVYDGLGSVVGLTDANGNLVASYKYDPYGALAGSTGTVANPWRFAGYYRDSTTGLYKVGVRYYDVSVGRWTQRDIVDSPLDEHGWNRYLYVGDDPVNSTDPMGLLPWCGKWQKWICHSAHRIRHKLRKVPRRVKAAAGVGLLAGIGCWHVGKSAAEYAARSRLIGVPSRLDRRVPLAIAAIGCAVGGFSEIYRHTR